MSEKTQWPRIDDVRAAHHGLSRGSDIQAYEQNASTFGSVFVEEAKEFLAVDYSSAEDRLLFLEALLDFLCEATSLEGRCQGLRDDHRVLIAALDMLKATAKPQIDQRNELEKLSGAAQSADHSYPNHLPVNFRSHLVRLLANLCFKHPVNQKLIRENDGISVIMNCTQLDADNPFIRQWSVFALRNLLDNCPENQRVVESMQPMGFQSDEDESLLTRLQAASKDTPKAVHRGCGKMDSN